MPSCTSKILMLTLVIGLTLSFVSCRAILIELFLKDTSAIKNLKILENDYRQIIYIPMVHVGTEAYYQEINEYLGEKRLEGYFVYYEGVKYDQDLSQEERYITDLKLRRLIGFHLSKLNDLTNKSLPNYVTKNINVYQTNENIGIDTLYDINADLSRHELVVRHENAFGAVTLDSCDFNTPLFDQYDCTNGDAYHNVVYKYREEAMIDKLLHSPHDKIVLLFGKSHWIKSIYPELVHKNGYKLVKGKI